MKNEELLKAYIKIWNKVSNLIIKKFDSQPVYFEKYLKTKMKFHNKKEINFHDNGMAKEGSHCVCLSVILIDSVYKIGKNYYLQVFLLKC